MTNATALLVVQARVYATLNVPAVTNLAPFIDDVPEGHAFPYIELGEIEEVIDNIFTKNGRSLLVSVHVYSELAGYKEVEAVIEQMNVLLDDTPLPDPVGWKTVENFYEIGSLQKETDGAVELRHAIARYRIRVIQP